jgi:hypothetical protein
MNNEAMTVANTIHAQIGGRAFYMLGAQNIVGGENFLQFKVRGSRAVNKVRIELTPADTYTVRFFLIRGLKVKEVATVEDVYVDSLHTTIEKHTGLYTSL